MRKAILIAAVVLATPSLAQNARRSPTIDFGDPGPTRKKGQPSVSPQQTEKKVGTGSEDNRKADEEAKQKAWDAKLKRTMSGICRGC
jgi:hypothetical protein